MSKNQKQKVAILGGGPGALSAAFWLSATPALRERYEVSLHVMGWRLGGKAASGRNAKEHQRIEEHGLHLMMGFYQTVFFTMRACYASMPMPKDPAFPNWQTAFTPQRDVTLWVEGPRWLGGHRWRPWSLQFPRLSGLPGDGPLPLHHDPADINPAVHHALKQLLDGPLRQAGTHLRESNHWHEKLQHEFEQMCLELHEVIDGAWDLFIKAIRLAFIHLLRKWQKWFHDKLAPILRDMARLPGSVGFDLYRVYVMIDLAFAGLIGLLVDVVPWKVAGYDRINHLDLKDWLRGNGASTESVESPAVMCLYDLAFAYVDGDSSSPRNGQLAAGAAVYTMLHLAFAYRDAPLWRMNAGMGDIIFTPLYTLLKKYGVQFHFFHRVQALALDASKKNIAQISIQPQASTCEGPYQPLKLLQFGDGRHWECWPAEPDWCQLKNGESMRDKGINFENPWQHPKAGPPLELKLGKDFDAVVLAIPPAAAEAMTLELSQASTAWAKMLQNTHSVATQSVQLWFRQTQRELGWDAGPAVCTTYAETLDSWATMDQTLTAECWPAGQGPQAVNYFCGSYLPTAPIPTQAQIHPQYIPEQSAAVSQYSRGWLDDNYRPMFPNAASGALLSRDFDWQVVQGSYERANVAYSDLYVQSRPGTIQYRLAPGQSGFDNLVLAGDWTSSSINGGSAEAAFESGMNAACALAGLPAPPLPDFDGVDDPD